MTAPHHQPDTIKGAIHNPADPHHFMIIQPVDHRVQVFVDGTRVADTESALRVIETGGHMLEPRLYIPEADVSDRLVKTDRATHCHLKGEASYFSLNSAEVAWRYAAFDFAASLDGHMSFSAEKLTIVEGHDLPVLHREAN